MRRRRGKLYGKAAILRGTLAGRRFTTQTLIQGPATSAWCVAPLTYKLAHRVWMYDANGGFQGTILLSEVLSLGDNGNTHSGSFASDFYDPNGSFLFEVTGDVAAEPIAVE